MQKSDAIPMQQKGGVKLRETWQSGAPFGEGNTFAIVTPIDKFATYDMPNLARRVLGDAVAQEYASKLAAITVSRRTFAVQDRAELSIASATNAKFVAAILTDTTIVSGHAERYESYIKKDLLPLYKKDNVAGFRVSRTVFGGNANEYHSMLLLSSFADIDLGPAQLRLLKPPSGGNGGESPAARGARRAHDPSLYAGSELPVKANLVGSAASLRSRGTNSTGSPAAMAAGGSS